MHQDEQSTSIHGLWYYPQVASRHHHNTVDDFLDRSLFFPCHICGLILQKHLDGKYLDILVNLSFYKWKWLSCSPKKTKKEEEMNNMHREFRTVYGTILGYPLTIQTYLYCRVPICLLLSIILTTDNIPRTATATNNHLPVLRLNT